MSTMVLTTVLSASLAATAWAVPLQRPVPAVPPVAAPAPVPAPEAPEAPRAPQRPRAGRRADEAQERRGREPRDAPGPRRGPWVEVDGEPFTGTFSGTDGDVLELINRSGTVVITGIGGREGHIVARRKAGGRTMPEARALLERMRLDISQHARRVMVRTEPASDGQMYRVDYEIKLPKGMGADVKNMSGPVKLANLGGDVWVRAMSGDIHGQGLARVRSLRTMSGDIDVRSSTVVGEANLQTVSGSVTGQMIKATSLTLGSVSGRIQLKDAGCERVNIRTVSGDIEFSSPALGGGRYELKTHGGSIVLVPGARSAGYEFEAQTFKGTIESEISGRVASEVTRELTGRVGNGSAFFDLTSFTGDIRIKK